MDECSVNCPKKAKNALQLSNYLAKDVVYTMNKDKAQFHMIEQQIRPWNVFDSSILNLMSVIPRELFVPEAFRNLAFADFSIPLAHHQSMYAPREDARMLQALELSESSSVLEIGTGSGFTTALLAKLARSVNTLDTFPEFIDEAQQRLQQLGISNVTYHHETVHQDWLPNDRYSAIVCSPAINFSPMRLLEKLSTSGRLFCVHGELENQYAYIYRKNSTGEVTRERLFEMSTPLIKLETPLEDFIF